MSCVPAHGCRRAVLALGLAAILVAPALRAQEVTFHPRRGNSLDATLADFLARGGAGIWTRDTVVSADGRVEGDLLVLEAQVRLAGSVEGDVYVVDGDLFLRPGARVSGDIVVLGGGYYGSGMATVDGEVIWRPAERYSVLPANRGFEIHPVAEVPDFVDLNGLYGFEAPRYQRVDAVTVAWGITLRAATWPGTTRPVFSIPVALSIMVFYALCAQCAATLAVIRRETGSWRWPLFTFAYMTTLAYIGAFVTYQVGMFFMGS